jgi:hypothetical protein
MENRRTDRFATSEVRRYPNRPLYPFWSAGLSTDCTVCRSTSGIPEATERPVEGEGAFIIEERLKSAARSGKRLDMRAAGQRPETVRFPPVPLPG